jgi:NADH-quinone oxidoreductase subunit B
LQNSVQQEVRPLSWMIGPQGVTRAPKLSMRDQKRATRLAATDLRGMDEI